MSRTILIAVVVEQDTDGYDDGQHGPWEVVEVRSVVFPDEDTSLVVFGLGEGQNVIELESGADWPLYDIPLPDAKERKEQFQGLSLQMGYW